MAIFNSYVKLPEGICVCLSIPMLSPGAENSRQGWSLLGVPAPAGHGSVGKVVMAQGFGGASGGDCFFLCVKKSWKVIWLCDHDGFVWTYFYEN